MVIVYCQELREDKKWHDEFYKITSLQIALNFVEQIKTHNDVRNVDIYIKREYDFNPKLYYGGSPQK